MELFLQHHAEHLLGNLRKSESSRHSVTMRGEIVHLIAQSVRLHVAHQKRGIVGIRIRRADYFPRNGLGILEVYARRLLACNWYKKSALNYFAQQPATMHSSATASTIRSNVIYLNLETAS